MDKSQSPQALFGPGSLEKQFLANPLMTAVKLARFKFPARMLGAKDDVLDLGCGRGYGTYFYASMTQGRVIGVDFFSDIAAVREQITRPNLQFLEDDLRLPSPQLLEMKHDAILSVDVIEHFSRDDGSALIENFSKTLNPGGMMILGTPNRRSAEWRSEQSKKVHIHEYEPEELRALCDTYFRRTFQFSMNDEIIHTGFSKLAWFFYIVAVI